MNETKSIEIKTPNGYYVVSGIHSGPINGQTYIGLPQYSTNLNRPMKFPNYEEAAKVVGVIEFLIRNHILQMPVENIQII